MATDSALPDDAALSRDERFRACIDRYWRRNVALMLALLLVWAGVSLGCGILFADALNGLRLGGFPLGFWFAQQGSIVIFVLLILVYALGMAKLDKIHHTELAALDGPDGTDGPGEPAGR